MRRSLLKPNYTSKILITVSIVVDLNQHENAMAVQRRDINYHPIRAETWMNRAGYVPGETMLLNVQIDDITRLNPIRKATAQFIQETKFADLKQHHHIVKETLWEKKEKKISHLDNVIPGNNNITWDNIPIIVPKVTPSGALTFCNLIEITYYIELNIEINKVYKNMKIKLNLTIGNVPLRNPFPVMFAKDNTKAEESLEDVKSPLRTVNSGSVIAGASAYSSPEFLPIHHTMDNTNHIESPPPAYEDCEKSGLVFGHAASYSALEEEKSDS